MAKLLIAREGETNLKMEPPGWILEPIGNAFEFF
jgi:hypothetical protein